MRQKHPVSLTSMKSPLFALLTAAILFPVSQAMAEDIFSREAAIVNEDAPIADAVPYALEILVGAEAPADARLAATRILDRAGPEASEFALDLVEQLEALSKEERWRISRVLVESTALEPELAPRLRVMAAEPFATEIREFAIRVLAAARYDDPEFIAVLQETARRESDPTLRRAAARALEETAYLDEHSIALFVALLDDGDENLRLIGARGLYRAGTEARRAVPHLLAALTAEDVYPHLQKALWRALLRVAPEDDRVVGPEVRRGHRAPQDELIPGMMQRLSTAFRERAMADTYQVDASVLEGTRTVSLRGWRSDEPMIPAFPEARGFGMWTAGGRGGEIHRVTNLNDDGPGSLREAIEGEGPRIVIFEVAGTIYLEDTLNIVSSHLTIAGQTAPGDGVAIAGTHTHLGARDVILRNLRFRPGSASRRGDKAINVRYADNVIIDQVSTSWAMEEVLSVTESGRVTVQRSLITHPLVTPARRPEGRGFGSLVRGAGPGRQDYAQGSNYSYLNNLWAHCNSRAPRPGNYVHRDDDPVGPLFDFRNNVIYNWGGNRPGDNYDNESITRYNFIANDYRPGPNTTALFAFNHDAPYAVGHWSANRMDGTIPEDQWSLVMGYTEEEHRRLNPFQAGLVDTLNADEAYEHVLAYAGAWPRDSYDRSVIEEVVNRTGHLIDEDFEVGGLPKLRPALAPVDTNRNGIPDWWQIKHGIAPSAHLDSAGDLNGTGYTNIEEYLNGTDMERFVKY